MDRIANNREFMKSCFTPELMKEHGSDQGRGVPAPPLQKQVPEGTKIVELASFKDAELSKPDIRQCLKSRRSRRNFGENKMSMAEFSYLLWSQQGVIKVIGDNFATLRTVPSGGARHPFETYVVVNNVEGLDKGVWRYLPLTNQLALVRQDDKIGDQIMAAGCGQAFLATSAATFVWCCIPYRGEWRYSFGSHKAMLLDAGHICQNLYLAAESVGWGVCGVAAYLQKEMDELLGVDGNDEFSVYVGAVGKK